MGDERPFPLALARGGEVKGRSLRGLLREARRRGLLPHKALGQHFLIHRGIAKRIVEGAEIKGEDVVLEVGPGIGGLTFLLLGRAKKVIAVEIDERLAAFLEEMAEGDPRLLILQDDALRLDLSALAGREGGKLKVVSNLPYNVSTPLFFHFLSHREALTSLTLMFQREVAERITSPPGRKSYGILAVYAGLYTRAQILFHVPPQAFWPPPQVEGAVVRLEVLPHPVVPMEDPHLFQRVLQACFQKRRKTLLNALSSAGLGTKEELRGLLQGLGLDPQRRGETLSVEELANLTNVLSKREKF